MIVVDASALVAIVAREEDSPAFAAALSAADSAIISPINVAEAGMVLIGRGFFSEPDEMDQWLARSGVAPSRDGVDHVGVLKAFKQFGKGRHPARLNLGDRFAYALAKSFDAPLLYKGDDFALTDIRSALQPT